MRMRIALVLLAAIALAIAVWLASVDSRGAATGAAVAPPSLASPTAGEDPPPPSSSDTHDVAAGAQPEPRAATRVGAIECRVMRDGTREPLVGFTVAMRAGGELVAERQSDARGACSLPRPAERGAVVRVEAPYGWIVLDPIRTLESVAEAPARLEFLARPSGFARWRARLVDELTLEPVPRYMLHLGTRDGQREELTSDGEGRIESEREYPESTLLVWGYDVIGPDPTPDEQRPELYREVEHRVAAGEAAELELAIPVGPTYRLDLDAPAKVDVRRLTASLLYRSVEPRLPPERGTTPVRWNDGPWVRFRFRSRAFFAWDTDPRYLCVVSADGLLFGGATVESARGVLPRVVPIVLGGRGRIVGRAVDGEGEPIARASVKLAQRSLGVPSAVLATTQSAGNGVFEFRCLPLGAFEIHAVSPAHERRSLAVDVAVAERIDVEIVLPAALDAGSISGRLVAQLDAQRRDFEVSLASTRPTGRRFTQRVELRPADDALAGEFLFDHVPEGDYRLSAEDFYDAGHWQPRSIAVAPPAANLEFRLVRDDDGEERALTCRIADAGTGEIVATAWVQIESRADIDWPVPVESENDAMPWPVGFAPEDRWWVCAPGYATYSGSPVRDFAPDGEVWRAQVALKRGFGCEVEVIGPRNAPIAGAELWLDGERAGVTDAVGRAFARRERAPASIDLRYRDWLVEPDDRAALLGALEGSYPHPRIRMSPP